MAFAHRARAAAPGCPGARARRGSDDHGAIAVADGPLAPRLSLALSVRDGLAPGRRAGVALARDDLQPLVTGLRIEGSALVARLQRGSRTSSPERPPSPRSNSGPRGARSSSAARPRRIRSSGASRSALRRRVGGARRWRRSTREVVEDLEMRRGGRRDRPRGGGARHGLPDLDPAHLLGGRERGADGRSDEARSARTNAAAAVGGGAGAARCGRPLCLWRLRRARRCFSPAVGAPRRRLH